MELKNDDFLIVNCLIKNQVDLGNKQLMDIIRFPTKIVTKTELEKMIGNIVKGLLMISYIDVNNPDEELILNEQIKTGSIYEAISLYDSSADLTGYFDYSLN